MNYYDLTVGMFCEESGRDDLLFCYESVREDFFSEISGEYLEESNGGKSESKLNELKEFCKLHKKRIRMCSVALAAVTALLLYLKSKGDLQKVKELEKLANEQKEKFDAYRKEEELLNKDMKELCREWRKLNPDKTYKPEETKPSKLIRLENMLLKAKKDGNTHEVDRLEHLLKIAQDKLKSGDTVQNIKSANKEKIQQLANSEYELHKKLGECNKQMGNIRRIYCDFAKQHNKIAKRYAIFKKIEPLSTTLWPYD